MSKKGIKRITSLVLVISMLLGGSGEQYQTIAASVSGSDSPTTQITSSVQQEDTQEDTQKENDQQENKPASNTTSNQEDSADDSKKNTDPDIAEKKSVQSDRSTPAKAKSVAKAAMPALLGEGETGENIPKIDAQGNLPELEKGKLYLISDYDGWKALAQYSQTSSLEGYRFKYNPRILNNGTTNEYNFASDYKDFEGIGTEDFPFKGELSSNYTVGNITLTVNKPLFNYLSSTANVNSNYIKVSGGSCAGLANYLIVNEDAEICYENIHVSGSIGPDSTSDSVGGLFAHVKVASGKTLTLSGGNVVVDVSVKGLNSSSTSNTLTGQTVGGLIGEVTGNMSLNLTGITVSSTTDTKFTGGVAGGIIGTIGAKESGKTDFVLTSSNGIEYSPKVDATSSEGTCVGGLFGKIINTNFTLNTSLNYISKQTKEQPNLIGTDVGVFAGNIESSKVLLKAPIVIQNAQIYRPAYSLTDSWENHGIGIFAGIMKDSEVSVDSFLTTDSTYENKPAITIQNYNFPSKSYNFKQAIDDNKDPFNYGGVVGYADNSDLKFSSNHPCKISNITTGFTRGNVSAGIGRYVVSDAEHKMQYVNVDTNTSEARLIAWIGNTGGLVGLVEMLSESGNLTVSDCSFNGTIGYAITNDDACFSTGIAKVTSTNPSGKLILNNVSCTSKFSRKSNNRSYDKVYGGVIGYINANFEISDTKAECSISSEKELLDVLAHKNDYYGGLVGIIDNTSDNTSDNLRTGKITGETTVGKCPFKYSNSAYGGLFGKVASKTAISIAGTVNSTDQTMYTTSGYVGSIAGEIDDALIYMEPETTFSKSKKYTCDEIGNYGGVIRNKDWGGDSKKLIEDFQVTGELKQNIDSMEDLLRFAIAMNTEGDFLPEVNRTSDTASLKSIDAIKTASYQLTGDSYALGDTGVVCLARNDDKGVKDCPFQGSFIGKASGKSKITYELTSCGQKNIGLFPIVKAGETNPSIFENLDIDGKLTYQSIINTDKISRPAKEQCAGGIAARAEGNITVKNVSIGGSIKDVSNCQWNDNSGNPGWYYIDSSKKLYEKKNYEDYLGGIFGRYKGADASTLTMEQLSCTSTSNLTCSNYTHVVGGVIGYVDLTGVKNGSCKIQIGGTDPEPITLSGGINVKDLDEKNIVDNTFPIKVGGLIAQIGETASDQYQPKCELSLQNIKVNGLNINETSKGNKDQEIGGLFGWQWNDVNVSLSNTSFTSSGLSVNAPFGGLVHTVCGKMLVDGLTFGGSMSIDAQSSGMDQCGLLVRDGQKLYLDVRNYSGYNDIQLKNYTKTFDELVGFTKNEDDSRHGGIVSIGSKDNKSYYLGRGENSPSYKSFDGTYVNNPNTRYYYDLNRIPWKKDDDTNFDISTLDSPEAVMRWHLLHYADPYLRTALNPDDTSADTIPKSYTITGAIDMTGYSIYPTPAAGETYTAANGASIKLNAEALKTGEASLTNKKYPDVQNCQHFQMHAGLFGDVSGITVDGLKITGSYSVQREASDNYAGALVAGSIYGWEKDKDSLGNIIYDETIKNTFSNIELDNLWCVSSENQLSYEAPIGLMIADISSGAQANFDHISMTGYTDENVSGKGKAASALIGNVGDANATDISLHFTNMDIADGAATLDSKSSAKDQVLAKASFIYSYNYKSDCNGIYTFNYEDYLYGRCQSVSNHNNLLTLGQELGNNGENPQYAIEEYYDKEMPVGKLEDSDKDNEIVYDYNHYLPYVCTTDKKIIVNPKAGHITQGCGTYEDPYVISSSKQLITLYRYLYDEDKFSEILKNGQWKMNPVGDDSKYCNGSQDHGDAVVYNGNDTQGFPTQNQLSQAYYQITADIDLSNYSEFLGFGREEHPFNGVFVGKEIPEKTSANPTIIMPKVPSDSDMSNYGWIQYAKGCVVRNLSIYFSSPVSINKKVTKTDAQGNSETIDEGGIGGGVIATVLGGENIIDGVSVKGTTTGCFVAKNTKTMIGGYVGVVNAGGVLLRNIGEYCFANFSVSGMDTLKEYPNVCGIVGKVFNGYVVYDGNTNSDKPLFKDFENTYSISLEQSRSYDIINGAYLKARQNDNDTQNGTIDYSVASDNSAQYDIANAVQLQVFSMALNAGLLNYGQTGLDKLYVGYNTDSRQRSGDYQYVGQVSETNKSARDDVIRFDNENGYSAPEYHSYLSQFFNWEDMKGNKDNLNKHQQVKQYTLSGSKYDMSQFGSAFRGLGARYFGASRTDANRADVFFGSLIGPDVGATITLAMEVDNIDKAAVQDAEDAAFLNNVIGSGTGQTIDIKNITLKGTVCNQTKDDVIAENGVGTKNAAGFISILQNVNVNFENVNLDTFQVASQRYAGGFVAYNPSSNKITFKNCNIRGTTDRKTQITGFADEGGLIGYTKSEVQVNYSESETEDKTLKSEINFLDVENTSNPATYGTTLQDIVKKNTGGLIGTSESSNFTIKHITGNHVTVKTTGDKQNVQIGGLVGRAIKSENNKEYTFQDVTLTNLTVQNTFDNNTTARSYSSECTKEDFYIIATAGIIGIAGGTLNLKNITIGSTNKDDKILIQNDGDKVPNHNAFCTAGVVGRHKSGGTIKVNDCKILGTKTDNKENTVVIRGRGSSVAGLFGNCNKLSEGKNITVQDVTLDAARFCGGIIAWLENDKECNLDSTSVTGLTISLSYNGSSSYGDVGGLIGHCDSNDIITLNNVCSENNVIESSYCKNVGGFLGYTNAKQITISGNNSIKNCCLGGANVGGVAGKIENLSGKINATTYRSSHCETIIISDNKIISSREDSKNTSDGYAGGFAGNMQIGNKLYVDGLFIENNLISGYFTDSKYATLGGVAGYMNSGSCFYHVNLKDNYIGMMKSKVLGDDVAARKAFLEKDINTLKTNIYFMLRNSSVEISGTAESATSVAQDEFYKYSYCQGAFLGKAVSTNGISKFIDAHVSYTKSAYRPVADVGTDKDTSLSGNAAMYSYGRERCAIVYDGRINEEKTKTIAAKFSELSSITGFDTNVPYVFGNIESIMENYIANTDTEETNTDIRSSYRLDSNYQNKEVIDSDNKNYSLQSVYNNTYKNTAGTYASPYKDENGESIPMVVCRTTENGSIDQVIQSYINILTNNSGGLNSYVNKMSDNNQTTVLGVTCYPMLVKNGRISYNNTEGAKPSISVTASSSNGTGKGNTTYEFSSLNGDDITSDSSGTFTLIRIEYGWKYTNLMGGDPVVHWTLDIPIYAEKRLKVTSNMTMLEGTQYNIDTIKQGKHVSLDDSQKVDMILTKGSGYSIYSEFIYENSEKFKSVVMSKKICIRTNGTAEIYFTPGTQLTLIPLDEGRRAYYYTVPENETKLQQIRFTAFADSSGNSYVNKDIKNSENTYEQKASYKDICNKDYTDVRIEQFVILVNRPKDNLDNQSYEMHVVREEDIAPTDPEWPLYSRTDYTDHCWAAINEIKGASYKINDTKTKLTASRIAKDGKVAVDLYYDVTAEPTYWTSVEKSKPEFADIGFSLGYQASVAGASLVKIPLPSGTVVTYGTGDKKKTAPLVGTPSTVYYYQGLDSFTQISGKDEHDKDKKYGNLTDQQVNISFDFSNADLSILENYKDGSFFVIAELVTTENKDLPAAGTLRAEWNRSLEAEMKSDFGFALNVDDMTSLGMNQYSPEESDQGVVSYTASIAFPQNTTESLDGKYYTIIYQIQEKTSKDGKPVYKPYNGNKVSLYLGGFNSKQDALDAVTSGNDSVKSGKGILAVTYQFDGNQRSQGADLADGINENPGTQKTANIIKTHCTLVANCEDLNMTNYRVNAYLMVSDSLPTLSTSDGNLNYYSESSGDSNSSCLKRYWVRPENWPTISDKILISDLKSDYFVFTVAKIKTTM